jgi:hypothetical protein
METPKTGDDIDSLCVCRRITAYSVKSRRPWAPGPISLTRNTNHAVTAQYVKSFVFSNS